MRAAATFLLASCLLGFIAIIPAGVLPKPYGLWLTIPLLFAGAFLAFTLTARSMEGRLSSFGDIALAFTDARSMLLSWSIYAAAMAVVTGLIALLAKAT
jgi:hypothetical protein